MPVARLTRGASQESYPVNVGAGPRRKHGNRGWDRALSGGWQGQRDQSAPRHLRTGGGPGVDAGQPAVRAASALELALSPDPRAVGRLQSGRRGQGRHPCALHAPPRQRPAQDRGPERPVRGPGGPSDAPRVARSHPSGRRWRRRRRHHDFSFHQGAYRT
eukprot:2553467-Rhodomonas_salina.2